MKAILILAACAALWLGTLFHTPDNPYKTYKPTQAVPAAIQAVPAYCVGHEPICDALRQAGFAEDGVHLMVAIGQAESHLRIDALGDLKLQTSKWGPSVGLFQIRTLKHPGGHHCRDLAYLTQNLSHQAECAYEISAQGHRYNPWTTYVQATYLKYM